jgi:hypothetical protein
LYVITIPVNEILLIYNLGGTGKDFCDAGWCVSEFIAEASLLTLIAKPTSDFVLEVSQLVVPAERTGRRVEGALKEIVVLPLVSGSSISSLLLLGRVDLIHVENMY